MRNVLKRMKNQSNDFSDFYFSSYDHFCTQNCQFSMNCHDNSKNKDRKIDFSFDSAYCASFFKMEAKLRGRRAGVHILSWELPNFLILLQHGFEILISTVYMHGLGEVFHP